MSRNYQDAIVTNSLASAPGLEWIGAASQRRFSPSRIFLELIRGLVNHPSLPDGPSFGCGWRIKGGVGKFTVPDVNGMSTVSLEGWTALVCGDTDY